MWNFVRVMATNTQTTGEILRVLWDRGRWWMIPMITVLLLFGLFLVFANATGVAPFIYTLF